MRVNVYAEEVTLETAVVSKEERGKRFVGIRFVLDSAASLHHHDQDDDRSAVTFWCEDSGRFFDPLGMAALLEGAAAALRAEAQAKGGSA